MIQERKRLLVLIIIVFIVAGCSQNQDEPVAQDYIYVAEQLAAPENSTQITQFVLYSDEVYFIACFERETGIYKMKTDEANAIELTGYISPEGTRAVSLCFDNDGYLWVAEHNVYPGETVSYVTYYLRKLDVNGSELLKFDISDDSSMYASDTDLIVIDRDNKIYLLSDSVRVFDSGGNREFFKKGSSELMYAALTITTDGTPIFIGRKDFASFDQTIPLQLLTPRTSDMWTTLATMDEYYLWNIYSGYDDEDFFYHNNSGLFSYEMKTKKRGKILNWADTDIDPDALTAVLPLKDGNILCAERVGGEPDVQMMGITLSWKNTTTRLLLLKPQESDSVPKKTTLRLAVFGSDSLINKQVTQFNKTNDEYRIEIIEYETRLNMQTYQLDPDAITRFNTEIVSNNPPDIVCAAGMLSIENYIVKGVFTDLLPYLDNETALGGRKALVPQVIDAFIKDSALYQMPYTFNFDAVAGRTDALDGRTSWTIDDIITLADSLPPGSSVFPNMTANTVLGILLRFNVDTLIDWQTGTSSFDNEEFIKILEFANTFPTTITGGQISNTTLLREGRALAKISSPYNFFSHAINKIEFGGDITYIGYPCNEGGGNAFLIQNTLAITSASKHKDAAWAFISSMLDEDFQLDNAKSMYLSVLTPFPVNKAALDAFAVWSSTPEISDDVEIPKTTAYIDSEPVDIYALSQQDIDEIYSLIENTNKVSHTDYTLLGIITDEATAYFAGQRSAVDAAQRIQNRVSLFINE